MDGQIPTIKNPQNAWIINSDSNCLNTSNVLLIRHSYSSKKSLRALSGMPVWNRAVSHHRPDYRASLPTSRYDDFVIEIDPPPKEQEENSINNFSGTKTASSTSKVPNQGCKTSTALLGAGLLSVIGGLYLLCDPGQQKDINANFGMAAGIAGSVSMLLGVLVR